LHTDQALDHIHTDTSTNTNPEQVCIYSNSSRSQ